jgi:hypothetical protein
MVIPSLVPVCVAVGIGVGRWLHFLIRIPLHISILIGLLGL